VIAIDPGCAKRGKGSACAAFRGSRLAGIRFARPCAIHVAQIAELGAEYLDRVIVERPQVDARTQGRERAVVDLAWAGAAIAYWIAGVAGARVEELTPTAWKGNARKPQHHARLWAVLTPAERALLGGDATLRTIETAKRAGAAERWRRGGGAAYYPAGFETHNLLDAVALGCFALGRLP